MNEYIAQGRPILLLLFVELYFLAEQTIWINKSLGQHGYNLRTYMNSDSRPNTAINFRLDRSFTLVHSL